MHRPSLLGLWGALGVALSACGEAGGGDLERSLDQATESDAGEVDGTSEDACAGRGTLVRADEVPIDVTGDGATLRVLELDRDAYFRICDVPAGEIPLSVLGAEPVGTVFRIDTDATKFTARVTANLSGEFADTFGSLEPGTAPIVAHLLRPAGGEAAVSDAFLDLSARLAGATLSHAGYLYFRHLDAHGATYRVGVELPGVDHVVGEVFSIGARVSVGVPSVLRELKLRMVGCGARPLSSLGTRGKVEARDCGDETAVVREGRELVGADAILRRDRVIDLSVSGAARAYPAPSFYCNFAGVGTARVELELWNGAERELTVRAEQRVSCRPTGDHVAVMNVLGATQLAHGPITATDMPLGTPIGTGEALFASDTMQSKFQPFGQDGFMFNALDVGSARALESYHLIGPDNESTLSYEAARGVYGEGRPRAVVSVGASLVGGAPFFGGDVRGELSVRGGGGSVRVAVPAWSDIDPSFGVARGTKTEVSFVDGSVDVLLVRGVGADEETVTVAFERWVRPSSLPLEGGRRRARLLTEEHERALAEAGVDTFAYMVGFFRATWDEQRVLWPEARVVPVLSGFALQVGASRMTPLAGTPCPTRVTQSELGCRAGPREVLAVAASDGVHLFEPVHGDPLGTLLDGADFQQVVQGPDHCLYASKHAKGADGGVFRFDHDGNVIDTKGAAYIDLTVAEEGLSTRFMPDGLAFFAGDLFVANEASGVARFDVTGAGRGEHVWDFVSTGLLPRAIALVPDATSFLVTDHSGHPGAHRVRGYGVPPTRSDPPPVSVDVIESLDLPEQVAMDFADTPNLLIALAGSSSVRAFSTAGAAVTKDDGDDATSDAPIGHAWTAGETPRGVFPLLDGHWLVAGEGGLGVQVITPGTAREHAQPTEVTSDAHYISRLCLPL